MTLLLLATASHAVLPVADDAHTWPAGLDRLELSSHAGDIDIHEASGDQIDIRWTLRKDEGCHLEADTRGQTAVFTVEGHKKSSQCVVDLVVKLPRGAELSLDLGAGDVEARGLRAAASLSIGAGDLEIETSAPLVAALGAGQVEGSATDEVEVSVGAGNVSLSRLTAPVEVSVGAGGIALRYDQAPRGVIEASSGVGSIEIALPAGTRVRGDLPRNVRGDVQRDSGAQTELDLSVAMGSVTISS